MKAKQIIATSGLLVAALAFTGCSSGSSTTTPSDDGSSKSITFAGFGGDSEKGMTKAWFDPYFEETGITVIPDSPSDYAKIQQMSEIGQVIWDVAQAGADIGVKTNGDILTEMDCTVIDCTLFDDGLFPVEKYGMPVLVYANVLAYNTETFAGNEPDSWDAFFDTEKYPGKRAVFGRDAGGGAQGMLDHALIADGVAIDDLYPLDVDRAFAKLDTVKDDIIFFTDFGECITLIATGEAAMGNCTNGRSKLAAEEGLPISWTWANQLQYADYLVIPKGSPNEKEAMDFLAYLAKDEVNGRLGEYIAYGPANPNAVVDPEFAKDLPTTNDLGGDDRAIALDDDWWEANLADVNDRWATWKAE